MRDKGYFQCARCWLERMWVRERSRFHFIAFYILSSILIALGMVKQFQDVDLLPSVFQFENDGLTFLAAGILLTVPALIRVIKKIFHSSKTTLRAETSDVIDSQTGADQSADLRASPVNSSGPQNWLKCLWTDKKRRGWFIDFGFLGVFLYLLYPVVPTYPPFDGLKVSNGTLSFQQIGARKNRHYPIFLDSEVYSCSVEPLGSRGTCFNERERSIFAGQQARVYWYKQGGRFGIHYPVAMQVEISGKAVLEYQKQIERFTNNSAFGKRMVIIVGIALFLILRLIRYSQYKRRQAI